MEVLLTDKSLQGIHPFSRRKALDWQLYFSRQEHLEKALDRAVELGISEILMSTHPLLMNLLKKDRRRWPFKISIVVPNFQQFVRDTSHYGTIGTALRRVLQLSFSKKCAIAKVSLLNLPKILKMKFSMLMNCFLMAETSQFFTRSGAETELPVHRIFLHQQMADLALSLGQSELFQLFQSILSKEFHTSIGICTRNFVSMNRFLKENGLSFSWMIAPFNPQGYWMNPDKTACEEALSSLQKNGTGVISDYWNLSDPSSGTSYLHIHPFRGATIEMCDLLEPQSQEWIKSMLS